MKYFIILAVIIFYICINDLFAQYRLQNHVDIGKTKISNGLYFSNSTYFDYSYNETTFKIGARVDLIDRTTFNRFFSGLDILVNQKIPLKKMELHLSIQYFMHLYSQWITENNGAILGTLTTKHFEFLAGLHFRNIHYNKMGNEFPLDNQNIFELWNLVYGIKYNLKDRDANWNVGIGITNRDYFVINQASNPMFYLDGKYIIQSRLTLFAEMWLLKAGVMNISANYYGSFLRTGILWNIK